MTPRIERAVLIFGTVMNLLLFISNFTVFVDHITREPVGDKEYASRSISDEPL